MALEHTTAPSALDWTLGDRLYKARRALGLEQQELAELLDVTARTISRWENDNALPRDAVALARQVEALGAERGVTIPAEWLLGFRMRGS